MATVFSLRWVYQGFFFVFLVGSAICGWASTSEIFIVGRAISGIGAAAITSGGLTIVSDSRPVIGGAFTEKVTWRWCFWINLPGGAITLLAMFFFFKVPSQEDGPRSTMQKIRSLDIVGSVLFVPGIFMLILALQWGGNAYAWKSATIIGLLVGAVVILGLFAVWESRLGDSAMIPGVLIARRTVLLSVIFSFCHLGALSVSSYYLPEWFQAVQGATPFESGIRVLPSVISQIVGTISAGAIALKIRYYNPWFYIGPVLMCTAAALYSQFTVSNTPSSQWIGYQVIQGLGVGFSMQMPSLMVQLALKDRADLLPIGVSLNIFAQFLGATVAQLLYQSGIANVRSVVDQYFPLLFNPIMEAYNSAIAQTHPV
ncbi:MFS transporter [Colletotrichum tofieldiae]|nr:MFS transporter [Colletotrichum tofieldiae]